MLFIPNKTDIDDLYLHKCIKKYPLYQFPGKKDIFVFNDNPEMSQKKPLSLFHHFGMYESGLFQNEVHLPLLPDVKRPLLPPLSLPAAQKYTPVFFLHDRR